MLTFNLSRRYVLLLFDNEAVESGRDHMGRNLRALKNTDKLRQKIGIVVGYQPTEGTRWPKKQVLTYLRQQYGLPERLIFSVEPLEAMPKNDKFLKLICTVNGCSERGNTQRHR